MPAGWATRGAQRARCDRCGPAVPRTSAPAAATGGQIIGAVTKQAARVRVQFRKGIAPIELEPIRTDDRFPVNFFTGFYPQPEEEKHLQWWVTKVIAYDQAGRKVAECQATAGPGHSC